MGWPTRYRCRKCTRSTSNYPIFCDKKDCPVKHDWLQDNVFGLVLSIVLIIGWFAFWGYAMFGSR